MRITEGSDEEMQTIFSRKAQGEVFESLKNIWKSDCEREEIWDNKKNWLDNYESNFGSDIFIFEENITPENNNNAQRNRRGYQGPRITNRKPRSNIDNCNRKSAHETFSDVVKKQPYIPTGKQKIPRLQQNDCRGEGDTLRDKTTLQKHANHAFKRNGTTFFGSNVRAAFLELSRYDKDRGRNTGRRNVETLNLGQNKQNSPIILDEETIPKEII